MDGVSVYSGTKNKKRGSRQRRLMGWEPGVVFSVNGDNYGIFRFSRPHHSIMKHQSGNLRQVNKILADPEIHMEAILLFPVAQIGIPYRNICARLSIAPQRSAAPGIPFLPLPQGSPAYPPLSEGCPAENQGRLT